MSRKHLHLILTLTVLAGFACAPLYSDTTPDDIANQVIDQVNAERQTLGLQPLAINEQLMWMAQIRSDDMLEAGYYSHTPPPGHPTLETLTAQLGYESGEKPIENLVWVTTPYGKFTDVAKHAVDAWRASPRHWCWVTSEYQKMTGVGVAVGEGYVIITQLFWDNSQFSPATASEHNREQ